MQTKRLRIGSYLFWILLGGLILRVFLFLLAQPWTPKGEATILEGSGDSLSYHYLAHDLVLYGRYGGNPRADSWNLDPAIRPLGYALFLAFWYWLFTPKIWIPILAQIALSTASIYLVYRIVQMMASRAAARLAALLYAIYPNSILHANSIMTEVLYNFLLLIVVFVWVRLYCQKGDERRWSWKGAAVLAIFAGLCVYARVASWYLMFAIVLLSTILAPATRRTQRLGVGLISIVGLLLTLTPYSLLMYAKYGTFRLTMTESYNMLFNTVGTSIVGRAGRLDPRGLEIDRRLRGELYQMILEAGIDPLNASPFVRERYFRALAFRYYREQPMTILVGSLAGMVRLWLWPDRIGEIANEVLPREASWRTAVIFTAYAVAMIHLLILLGLTVLGTPRAYRAHRKFFWLFFTVVLYATLTSNAVGNDRYRMQAMPVVFPMAGIGYDALLRRRAASTQQESSHS